MSTWRHHNRHRLPQDLLRVEQRVLKHAGGRCEACEQPNALTVDDHCAPAHNTRPGMLPDDNLTALCTSCTTIARSLTPRADNRYQLLTRVRSIVDTERLQGRLKL